MLKREITYEDFNGNSQTETFYFNLTKTELLRMEVSVKGGLADSLVALIKKKDNEKELFAFFEELITASYGEKSEDGKKFIKNQTIRDEFLCSAPYDQLMIELTTNANTAGDFVNGVIPRDIAEAANQEELKQKMAEKMGTKEPTTAELVAGQIKGE